MMRRSILRLRNGSKSQDSSRSIVGGSHIETEVEDDADSYQKPYGPGDLCCCRDDRDRGASAKEI
jgi:hypothetical protein